MNITPDEKLALLVAMDKQLKPELDNAKAEARQALLEGFEETHADRRAVMVGTEKVGEVGISFSTARPYMLPDREEDALAYLSQHGLTVEKPCNGWEKGFKYVDGHVIDNYTGEDVSDLFGWQPSTAKTASVRGCKPADVAEAFQGRLSGQTITAFIEGGVE